MGAVWPIMKAFGAWRSLVAHLYGVQGVAGSNPVAPMDGRMALRSPSHGVPRGHFALGWRWMMAAGKTVQGSAGTDEILTVKEIEERYPSEWVLIEDPEVDEQLDVVRGKVIWHSSDRDEVYQKAIDLRTKSAATIFTGPWPENMEYVL
jgi:hypothetical protein